MGMSVTLAQIAAVAGVSRMTVSRALRQRPRVAPEVRERVLAVARELGWKPDPKLSRAMTEVRASSRRVGLSEKLALVWPDGDAARIATRETLSKFRAGAGARAEEQGFALEEFFLETGGVSARRLTQMLYARGTAGVIVAPVSFHAHLELNMDWTRFAAAAVGVGLVEPRLSRVYNNHHRTMTECLRRLAERGNKRIGLALWRETAERLDGLLDGAFLARHPLGCAEAAELLLVMDGPDNGGLARWLERTRPELVIGEPPNMNWMGEALARLDAGVRRSIGYATFNWQEGNPRVAGMNQRFDRIGAAAVDVVVAQYNRNEHGVAGAPKTILTESEWHEPRRPGRGAE